MAAPMMGQMPGLPPNPPSHDASRVATANPRRWRRRWRRRSAEDDATRHEPRRHAHALDQSEPTSDGVTTEFVGHVQSPPAGKMVPPRKRERRGKRLTGVGKYLDLFDQNDAEVKKDEENDDESDVEVNDDGEIIEIDEETKKKKQEEKEKYALLPAKAKKN